jgi:hypothetical protein
VRNGFGVPGGGIANTGTLVLSDSLVTDNISVVGGGSGVGGGISNEGTLTLIDSLVVQNIAEMGGGIYNSGILSLIGSGVGDNQAEEGGGIYDTGTGTVTLDATSSEIGNVPDDCVGTPAC